MERPRSVRLKFGNAGIVLMATPGKLSLSFNPNFPPLTLNFALG